MDDNEDVQPDHIVDPSQPELDYPAVEARTSLIDLDRIIAYRLERTARINASPLEQQVEMSRCADDVGYFLSNWAWTFDPREADSVIPFEPFPRQLEMLRWTKEREDARENGLVVKSRATGVTYCYAGYAVHGLLFRRGWLMGFGSRKLEYVDDATDPKSIFWKVRNILYNLPWWMMPKGFNRKKHDAEARIWNPDMESGITGEGGDNIGRGARSSLYVVDEAAHLERPELVEASLSMTTKVRIDVSTPWGNANVFARKALGGRTKVFEMRWQDCPLLTEEMRERYLQEYGAAMTAQEWDLDFTASVPNLCIPGAWVQAAIDLLDPDMFLDYPVEAGCDVAEEKDLFVYLSRQGPIVRRIESWTNMNTTESAWRARDIGREDGATIVRFDAGGVGSGVKGPFATCDEGALPFRVMGIMFGGKPTLAVWPESSTKPGVQVTSRDKFVNLRAEMWWMLRVRFEKAYEYSKWLKGEGGAEHPLDEMISIPKDIARDFPELIGELSMPKYYHRENGKILLEPKENLPKSPDYADAAVQAFAPLVGGNFWIR